MAVGKSGGTTSGASGATAATSAASRRQTAVVVVGLVLGIVAYESLVAGPATRVDAVPLTPANLQQGRRDPVGASVPEEVAQPDPVPIGGGGRGGDVEQQQPVPTKGKKPPSAVAVGGGDNNYGDESPVSKPSTGAKDAATLPTDDKKPACWPVCYPFHLRSGSLFVQRKPNGLQEPSMFRTSGVVQDPASKKPWLSFPPEIKRVAIDIGTHADPDTQADWWGERDLGMIWFEPIVTLHTHPMHLPQTRATQSIGSNRVVGIPAAVAPKPGHMAIFLSAVSGCTSLLEMNDKALKDPSVMQGSFVGSDSAFPDYSTAKSGFTGCLERVTGRANREIIPVVRGDDVVDMIPPHLTVSFLATDAQGFDLHVVSSFGSTIPRIEIILVECQDLPEGHAMFLTKGAYSCSDIRECMRQYSPEHKMIAAANGEPADTCTINSPSHERNCLFRRMDKPYFKHTPKLLTRPAYKINHPTRKNLQCPPLLRPTGIAEIEGLTDNAF